MGGVQEGLRPWELHTHKTKTNTWVQKNNEYKKTKQKNNTLVQNSFKQENKKQYPGVQKR